MTAAGPATILVVDDEEDVRRLVAFSLKRSGFEVLEAASGAAAIELVQSESVGLIVLDVSMPLMSGLDVVATLRSRSGTATLPILLMTGSGDEDSVIQGLAAGADDFLPKPVRLDELVARVRARLRMNAAWSLEVESELRTRADVVATLGQMTISAAPDEAATDVVRELAKLTDSDAVAVLQLPGAIRDGRGQPDVHDRGSQVGDQCAHLVEAVPEHVPQEGQLGVGGAVFGSDHAVEVLDLEDGVRQDLGGAVMDVLGHALALAFLGLDDAQSHRGGGLVGHRPGLVDARIRGVEVPPQEVHLAGDDVHALEARLESGELSAALLDLGAERIGADRPKAVASAVQPRSKLHPVLEVGPILLTELLGELVHATRIATKDLRGLGADAVEALRDRSRCWLVRHGSPAQVPGPA